MRILATIILLAVMSLPIGARTFTSKEAPLAPSWDISEWINSPGLELKHIRGQVVIVDFFQLWCPGCNRFSIPLIAHWEENIFAEQLNDERITFVSIHTVFEGHSMQTPKRLRAFIKEKEITHAVGIDRHKKGQHLPETMKKYRTRGTPEIAIIDKKGRIRFQKFGYFEPAQAEALIRKLLAES